MDLAFFERLGELADFRLCSCLALAGALFSIGAWGVMARRNILIILISIELMLNAVMLTLVSFARAHAGGCGAGALAGENGQIFALFLIAVAACEAGVGLAIVVSCFRSRPTVDTREMGSMRH